LYNDEYASIFGTFRPFAPPHLDGDADATDNAAHLPALSGDAAATHGADSGSDILARFFGEAQVQKDEGLQRRRRQRQQQQQPESGAPSADIVQAIGIKKIRRKKMNKHKWKKQRKAVRNSTRYNKARIRRGGGPTRQKQE
ncbi:hypothetical protein HK405_000227, partial [Cladochytrium tenue]